MGNRGHPYHKEGGRGSPIPVIQSSPYKGHETIHGDLQGSPPSPNSMIKGVGMKQTSPTKNIAVPEVPGGKQGNRVRAARCAVLGGS